MSSHRHLTLIPGERPAPEAASRPGDSPRAADGHEEELLQVGDLARAVGKTVRAIHLYEEMGLLKAHERSKGRYRLFTPDAVVRVRWIGKLQSLGLSLSEIQGIDRARTSPPPRACARCTTPSSKRRAARSKSCELSKPSSWQVWITSPAATPPASPKSKWSAVPAANGTPKIPPS